MALVQSGSGVATTIAGTGTVNGIPYVDIAVAGTASSTSALILSFRSGITSGNSATWSVGWRIQSVAGTPQIGVQPNLRTNLGGTGAIGTNAVAPTTMSPIGAVLTTPASGVTSATMSLRLNFTNGVVYSETIRIALPQFRQVPFMDAPILPPIGSPGAATRAQGSVTLPVQQFGTRWNRRQGILIVDWSSQPGPFTSSSDSDWFGLASWGDTSADNRLGILVNPAHTSVEARCTAGGAVQTASSRAISAPAAGQSTRAAVAWDLDAGFLQVAARGSAGSKVALTALPVPGFLMPGRYATSNPLFGNIQGLDLRPGALFDASLAALTT
jgi:hypothetical protein